jgi:hypothetical protein
MAFSRTPVPLQLNFGQQLALLTDLHILSLSFKYFPLRVVTPSITLVSLPVGCRQSKA